MELAIPAQLPIADWAAEIQAALVAHQVIIVAGETGSGKTTQLPKIALAAGRGSKGMIGHTQPRRIAARSLAARIAQECGTELGTQVGFAVRFSDRTSPQTLVKVMTDGILLAELGRDRNLSRYDTIIIDEAHERSLNIDFLLGYMVRLLPRRPQLKLIVTSATIDVDRFSAHFSGAPVIEVSGRTYPVEIRYRPIAQELSDDLGERDDSGERAIGDDVDPVCSAVLECLSEGPGDVLVFLSGQREIHDVADALSGKVGPTTEILPLYSRLSVSEQQRIFTPGGGRRVVLATNVAETSITVPGIRFVVDPGTARISRYSRRLKVQRLPIEAISQASANQRAGRCGRVSDGICIRLYSQADFQSRPQFTDPEILRTNLASVVLAMANLRLGPVAEFPFLDPPDPRAIRDGVLLLEELGALSSARITDDQPQLTKLGRDLARVPLDPRLARMVLAGAAGGCLREVVVIAAGLTIQDPRERPAAERAKADAAHARHAQLGSDLLGWLNLWDYIAGLRQEHSSSGVRRRLRLEYLNYLRVREWQDLVGQIREITGSLGMKWSSAPDDPDAIHRALLTGLISHIGLRDPVRRDYLGARGARFVIFPGSVLHRRAPDWVMAAELVETSRLFAREVAAISPQWVEELAGDLVVRNYSQPHWSPRRGAAMAHERVTIYGIPIVADRLVNLGAIDPVTARELLIREALVAGNARVSHLSFWKANRDARERAEQVEARARKRGLVLDEEGLFDFYDSRIPADIVNLAGFEAWWKVARRKKPDLLDLTDAELYREGSELREGDYPVVWSGGPDLNLAVSYQFEPGAQSDGVTVEVPLEALPDLVPSQVPGVPPGNQADLVAALLRSLPKPIRRAVGPVPNALPAILDQRDSSWDADLIGAVAASTTRVTGVDVRASDFDLSRVPAHLLPRYRVVDEAGQELAQGRDLAALQEQLAPDLAATLATATSDIQVRGATSWVFGEVPVSVTRTIGGRARTGYPAICDGGDHVDLLVLTEQHEQRIRHTRGLRRLVLLTQPGLSVGAFRKLDARTRLLLGHYRDGAAAGLLADCVAASVDEIIGSGELVWDASAFQRLQARVRCEISLILDRTVASAAACLETAWELDGLLERMTSPALEATLADLRDQSDVLSGAGFVSRWGVGELSNVRRYLSAALWRAGKAPDNPGMDSARMAEVAKVDSALAAITPDWPVCDFQAADAHSREARRLADEFRVHVFAQHIRTSRPVSAARVAKFVASRAPLA